MKERPDKVYVSFLESGTMSCVYPFREHEDDELYVSLDKACKWLMKYFVFENEGMTASGCDVFLRKFRKAMEE